MRLSLICVVRSAFLGNDILVGTRRSFGTHIGRMHKERATLLCGLSLCYIISPPPLAQFVASVLIVSIAVLLISSNGQAQKAPAAIVVTPLPIVTLVRL